MLGASINSPTQELQKDVNWMVENYDGERVATWDVKCENKGMQWETKLQQQQHQKQKQKQKQ